MKLQQLLQQLLISHRINIVNYPDVHLLRTLLEEGGAAGGIITRHSHCKGFASILSTKTASDSFQFMKGIAAGLSTFTGNEYRCTGLHKYNVYFI